MDANLKARIAAAVVLIPVAVACVLFLPAWGFAVFMAVFVLAGAWEWAPLAGLPGTGARSVFTLCVAAGLAGTWYWPHATPSLLWAAAAYWLVCAYWVISSQCGRKPAGLASTPVKVLAGWLTLVPAWAALALLHRTEPTGPMLVLFVMVLVWGADVGAYFAGRRFGRRKLASRVSPGKTWEGVAGAMLTVLMLAVVFWWLYPGAAMPISAAGFIALSLFVGAVSVLGDLAESLFKRSAGLKDSGGIIPGHGGVLDRLDSITAAGPWFALGLALASQGVAS